MPYAVTGMGGTHIVLRKVDGERSFAIERHGVTLLCGAPAVVAAILGAAERGGRPGAAARARHGAHGGGGRAAAVEDIERVEAELGWGFIQIYG